MQRRSAKTKGNSFEYDTEYSLKHIYNDIVSTDRRGFSIGYDLISNNHRVAIECKNHQSFTWNELAKYYNKLKENAPDDCKSYLIFHANRQPVLVMDDFGVRLFQDVFNAEWRKRPKGHTKNENTNKS